MKTCWFIVIESMGDWWVDCEGKAYGPFETKDDAEYEAKYIAMTYGDQARRAQVFAAEENGAHRLIWSGPVPAN